VENLVRAWPALEGAVDRPQQVDLDGVAERIVRSLREGVAPERRDWRLAAWCLWRTKPALVSSDIAFEALLAEVTRMEQRGPYRRLASTYLLDYASDRARIGQVSQSLALCAERAGEPWRSLQKELRIFEGEAGVRRVAEAALRSSGSVPALLSARGLGTIGSEAGFAEAGFLAGLHILQRGQDLTAASHLARIQAWSVSQTGEFIYLKHRAAVANTLTDPFSTGLPEGREGLVRFLVERLGDPRTRPGHWIGAEAAAVVVKRWLTELSLRAFLDIIGASVADRTWKFRRSFWMGVYDAGLITDAYVVFGNAHLRMAERVLGKRTPDNLSFGEFLSGGRKTVEDRHAVLLMTVGNGVVADWSHNGRCNIWRDAASRDAPQLHRRSYTSDDMSKAVGGERMEANLNRMDVFTHNGSETYVWQNRVAARLKALTGRVVPVH
jgi:hypothetical protein